MFVGHFAVGFASKRWAPRANLGWLLLAPLLADVIWPVLILMGVEQARVVADPDPFHMLKLDDMPWSHSLLLDMGWAVLLGLVVGRLYDRRAGVVVGIGVISHWVLDWITHPRDMLLVPGGTKYGLDLWRSVPGTMSVELAMFAVSLWLYTRATRARDTVGRVAFWSLVAFLLVAYVGSTVSPPPPSIGAVGVTVLALGFITIPWAVWIDRHRVAAAGDA